MVDGKLVSETLDVYLVTDYYSNGDLYSLRTMLDQQQAKIIFKQSSKVPGGCDGRAATPSSDRLYQEEHEVAQGVQLSWM
eukprot:jgi/Pico_ML_1/55681/g1336.t1